VLKVRGALTFLPPSPKRASLPPPPGPSSSGAFFCALYVISYAKPAACRSETASRFARDLIVAETGFRRLRDAGITLIAADAPNSFLDETPTSAFIRQVLAAVQELEKAMIVSKLKAPVNGSEPLASRLRGERTTRRPFRLHSIAPRRLRAKV
jgi:Resolvase, N terminal domain